MFSICSASAKADNPHMAAVAPAKNPQVQRSAPHRSAATATGIFP